MRGREGQPGRVERGTGITPAYAGKSRPAVIIAGHFRDHPRVCGEERKRKKLTGWQRGSPPRMRGRAVNLCHFGQQHRITPAYAGKSPTSASSENAQWDHPRVCGEEQRYTKAQADAKGSPPRMRGRAGFPSGSMVSRRITPAYAGKSVMSRSKSIPPWDHPRVCGEKQQSMNYVKHSQGSPPRVRGKGFHPLLLSALSGSPPRVRGKVPCCTSDTEITGITPACAGKRLKRSHRIGHFSCILCLFHSVLHRASASGGSRAGPCAPPCLPAQNAVPV